MSISNLDAKKASATFDSRKKTVTLTHDDERKNSGKPLEIPVGALRSVEWAKAPKEGKERVTGLEFRFRHPQDNLPKAMRVGKLKAVTSRTNVAFVEEVQEAIAHTKPNEKWQAVVDYGMVEKIRHRQSLVKTIVAVLLVAAMLVGLFFGVQTVREKRSQVSNQAAITIASMSEEEKAPLFHNYLVMIGIKGKQRDEVNAAKAVCRQFDKGYSFGQIAAVLLMMDNGMTSQQKGKFIGASVNWWCPQHKEAMHQSLTKN